MIKAAEEGQGFRSQFICLKEGKDILQHALLAQETMDFEELIITFTEMHTKAINRRTDTIPITF